MVGFPSRKKAVDFIYRTESHHWLKFSSEKKQLSLPDVSSFLKKREFFFCYKYDEFVCKSCNVSKNVSLLNLTDTIFETGAAEVPSKSHK